MKKEFTYEELYEACLYAAQQMGDRIKGMSLFVSNWKDQRK